MEQYLTVKQLPKMERPYEKAFAYGVERLSDAELLAIILRTGTKKLRSVDLAVQIRQQTGGEGLVGLFEVTQEDLLKIKGIGKVKAIQILTAIELAKRLSESKSLDKIAFTSPEKIAGHYMERLRHERREHTILLLLDGKNRLIKDLTISIGTVNASLASPREIFLEALRAEAVFVVLLHNHPSGDPTPSRQDVNITKVIKEAGKIIGISLLDHIIIGDKKYVSMRELDMI